MSKQAGNSVDAKPRLQKLDPKQFAADQQAKPAHKTEQQKQAVPRDTPVAVATNKLSNDAFACYADVDVSALQAAAIDASNVGEAASRKETQMQIANILARYAQEKLIADASPINLYTVQADNTHALKLDTVKFIARHVYEVSEKTLDGKKNPLPRHLEQRIRRIAPLVYFAIQERIPLVWSDETKALMVPTWMLVSDGALAPPFWDPETAAASRMMYNKPIAVDGKDGRTLDAIIKRVEAVQKPKGKGTNSADVQSAAAKNEQAMRSTMFNHGLETTLKHVADMFQKAPENKPFADSIVELLAVCCEHVNVRNGEGAMGAAVAEMKPKASKPKQSAA